MTAAQGATVVRERWPALVGGVYLLVALGLLARALVVRWSLGRALRTAHPAGPALVACADGCRVDVHPTLGPLVAGGLRPRIVIPEELACSADHSVLASILKHEVAHVRRRDGLLLGAVNLLSIAAWPVIPVWIAAFRVRALIESACDERAIADADASERRRYGETLLALADPGAIGLAFGSRVGDRIRALRWRRRWPAWAQVGCAVGLMVAFVACSGAPTGEAPASEKPLAAKAIGSDQPAPDGVPAADAVHPDVVPGTAAVRGSLDKEIIRRIIRRHLNEVKSCYEQELLKQPDIGGRVMVQFTIAATGQVVASVLQSSTLGNTNAENCIVQTVRRWEFPKPLDGGIVVVTYPFVLTPAG